ncbi:MAG: hypothetical protein ACM3NQ_06035 [Bacteroidales bacterium]
MVAIALGPPAFAPAHAQKLALPDVLAKAAEAASAFADASRILFCEEHYKQVLGRVRVLDGLDARGAPTATQVETVPQDSREWVAELAVAATPAYESAGMPWMEFRDVMSVDGKPVRDGTSRLRFLAEQPIDAAVKQALTISGEAPRRMLGRILRIIAVPRMPAIFLHPAVQGRFDFKKGGEKTIDGIKGWEVKYREKSPPSIIRGSNGGDALSSGSFWIDPASGQVLMSVIKSPDSLDVYDQITVTYRKDVALGLWLPAELKEKLTDDDGRLRVEGTGTFTNWRAVARKPS